MLCTGTPDPSRARHSIPGTWEWSGSSASESSSRSLPCVQCAARYATWEYLASGAARTLSTWRNELGLLVSPKPLYAGAVAPHTCPCAVSLKRRREQWHYSR